MAASQGLELTLPLLNGSSLEPSESCQTCGESQSLRCAFVDAVLPEQLHAWWPPDFHFQIDKTQSLIGSTGVAKACCFRIGRFVGSRRWTDFCKDGSLVRVQHSALTRPCILPTLRVC